MVVVEDNWLEVVSDIYSFNIPGTVIVGHGLWTYTGGASIQDHSTNFDHPIPHAWGSANTLEAFSIYSMLPDLGVGHSLSNTVFSGKIVTCDYFGSMASTLLKTNWRFTTSRKTRFMIKMRSEDNSLRGGGISFAIIDNINDVVLYRDSGSDDITSTLTVTGILPANGVYTLVMIVDRSTQPFEPDNVSDGQSDFLFAIEEEFQLSPNVKHAPVQMPLRRTTTNRPFALDFGKEL